MSKKPLLGATGQASDRLSEMLPVPSPQRDCDLGRTDTPDSRVVLASGGRAPQKRMCRPIRPSRRRPDPRQRSRYSFSSTTGRGRERLHFLSLGASKKMQPGSAPSCPTGCSEQIAFEKDDMNLNQTLPIFFFLSVASVALFSFVAVAVWSSERRREREAYYRSETLKKIADTQGAGSTSAIEFL